MEQTQTGPLPRLNIWERVEIIIGEGPGAGRYVARIENLSDDSMIISTPDFVGGDHRMNEDGPVTVLITRSDGVYQFKTQLRPLTRPLEKSYVLKVPDKARRVQRRRYVRVEINHQVEFARVPTGDQGLRLLADPVWQKAALVNLSGGGALLELPGEPGRSDRYLLNITLFETMDLTPQVAGVCRRTSTYQRRMYAGIEFVRCDQLADFFTAAEMDRLPSRVRQFTAAAQTSLVAHIFRRQIQMRRQGLL